MAFNPREHLMDLKGRDYLQIMWRLVWFREEKPLWSIDTRLEQLSDEHAVFSARICDENGVQKSAGYGSESRRDFRDFIEKAETKAVGRALAMLGYGTQFAPEMDEQTRLADAPVARSAAVLPAHSAHPPEKYVCEACGELLRPYVGEDGKEIALRRHCAASQKQFGKTLCLSCIRQQQAQGA